MDQLLFIGGGALFIGTGLLLLRLALRPDNPLKLIQTLVAVANVAMGALLLVRGLLL